MMLRVDKVVARKKVSIVFDDGNVATGPPKDTQRMLLSKSRSGGLLDDLHFNAANIPARPLIEDGAEKRAKGVSRHRALADAVLGFRLQLDQG